MLAMGAQVGGISQIAKLGTERIDRPAGAAAVTAIALGSVLGRLAGGAIADRLAIMPFTAVLTVLQGGALAWIAFAGTRTALIVGAFAFGTTIGNLLMLQSLIVASAFGVVAYPRIFALHQLIVTAGIAGGPFLLGFLHDQASYRASYLAAAGLSVGASLFLMSGGIARPSPSAVIAQSAPRPVVAQR